MAEPTKALHKALLAALDSACSCPVYDAVPHGATMPYVTLNTMIASNIDHLGERHDERFVFLSIWSESRGQAEVLGIIGEIDSLHDSSLSLDTGSVVSVRVDEKATQRDSDNVTFQGTVVLRVLTSH